MFGKKRKNKVKSPQNGEKITQIPYRMVGSIMKMGGSDAEFLKNGEILYYDPLIDPQNFIRRPFGVTFEDAMNYHIERIRSHLDDLLELHLQRGWYIKPSDCHELDKIINFFKNIEISEDNWKK